MFDKKIIKDYFSLIKFKNKHLILYILFNIIGTGLSLLIPVFASAIIEKVTLASYGEVLKNILFLAITYLFHNLCSYNDYKQYALFFQNVYVELHRRIISSIYKFDESFSKKISIGKIINSSNMDLIDTAELPSHFLELIIQTIKLCVIIFIFARNNIFIAIYVLMVDLLYAYWADYCNRRNGYFFKKQKKSADKLMGLLSQVLRGIKDIKSFSFEEKLNNKFDGYRKKWANNYLLTRKYLFSKLTIVVGITELGEILLYLSLLYQTVNNKIAISSFLLLISYYKKSKETVEFIMSANMNVIEQSVALYRIREILDYKVPEIKTDGFLTSENVIGKIEFRNVSFSYGKLPTLNDVSFTVYPNETTTIVGETGAGKTTILNLLMRFNHARSGTILLDDIDIWDYEKNAYNSNVAIVNQKTFLFNDTIRQNLALVDKNKERQIDACKRVGIHDFIMSLPDGYSTVLKENTANLSGGQKQLLSLARALLTSSEIILLDEVTSALDPKTTGQIIKLLDDLKSDHTILTISHNKDLMRKSDKLIVLKKGKVVGVGSHSDLIKNNSFYKSFYYDKKES